MQHTRTFDRIGRKRLLATASTRALLPADDQLLVAKQSAEEVGLSLPTFWRAVRDGRLPAPFYPAPRAPRWRRSELRAALEALRLRPADALAERMDLSRKAARGI
jgi:predicted DNA-binding transcriptional regulator AlpA